jgi:molybdopterin molybdotransferase
MISYQEALKIIRDEFSSLKLITEDVDLLDSLNRILAEDVYADTDLPPYTNSSMDGYAVKFNPSRCKWKLTGEISAGNYNLLTLTDDDAVRVMTGSKLPIHTSAVIPVEEVNVENNIVKLSAEVLLKENQYIRKMGEDISEGTLCLPKNQIITSNKIPLLGACGKDKVKVYGKLKIGVLATGDELVDINSKIKEDEIRGTNLYSLISAVNEMNMTAVNLGFVKDNKEKLRESIARALDSDIDILLTSGGVSVGKYDYLNEIFIELGIEIKFWKVNIKPGKPLVFAVFKKNEKQKFIFGLPGNPVSAFVTFALFVKPAVEHLYGVELIKSANAEIEEAIIKNDNKRNFLRGILTFNFDERKYFVKAAPAQSSGDMVQLSNANCLIVIEEERLNPQKGEMVKCIMI